MQSGDSAERLLSPLLKAEFPRHGTVPTLPLRYTPTLNTRMAQTAACHRGYIQILDRAAPAPKRCTRYAAVTQESDRLSRGS